MSFSFDDFPKSALHVAGAMLEERGWRGTYYASFGLMGKIAPTGKIFSEEDLGTLAVQGHELGCHTFHHCHAWDTQAQAFVESARANNQFCAERLQGRRLESHAYPISGPRPSTKRALAELYDCARGGGQDFNVGVADAMLLRAFFLEQSTDDFERIERLVLENQIQTGWLIFATHDVDDQPTPYGCTPAFFERVVNVVERSGARVMPVREAFKALTTKDTSVIVAA